MEVLLWLYMVSFVLSAALFTRIVLEVEDVTIGISILILIVSGIPLLNTFIAIIAFIIAITQISILDIKLLRKKR